MNLLRFSEVFHRISFRYTKVDTTKLTCSEALETLVVTLN